jgi:hypothetical protein
MKARNALMIYFYGTATGATDIGKAAWIASLSYIAFLRHMCKYDCGVLAPQHEGTARAALKGL